MARRQSQRYRMRRRKIYRAKRRFSRKGGRLSRLNNTKKVNITIPVETTGTWTVPNGKEFSNIVDFDILTLARSLVMGRHVTMWDAFKINSMSVNIMPLKLSGALSNARFKIWSLCDTEASYKDKEQEKALIAAGVSPGAFFRNNPASKWSVHVSGNRNSHKHYTKALTLNHKTTYLDHGFLDNDMIGYVPGAAPELKSNDIQVGTTDIVDAKAPANAKNVSTGYYSTPNAGNAYLPRIKCAIQTIDEPVSQQQDTPFAATVRFNVTFKGIRYAPSNANPVDTTDLNLLEN